MLTFAVFCLVQIAGFRLLLLRCVECCFLPVSLSLLFHISVLGYNLADPPSSQDKIAKSQLHPCVCVFVFSSKERELRTAEERRKGGQGIRSSTRRDGCALPGSLRFFSQHISLVFFCSPRACMNMPHMLSAFCHHIFLSILVFLILLYSFPYD